MAASAGKTGAGVKKQKPQRGEIRQGFEGVNNSGVIHVENHSTNVIPFKFDQREIRTLLIDEQPWFVASDVALALEYRDASNMCRNLDDDERGTQIVSTPSTDQEMLVINESGLYSAILRSRKAEARRFKKWVTSVVLPTIRLHGRFDPVGFQHGAQQNEIVRSYKGHPIRMIYRDSQWLFCLDDMVPAWTRVRSPAKVDQVLWRVREQDRVTMTLGGQSVVMLGEGPVWSLLDRIPNNLLRLAFGLWFREDLMPSLRRMTVGSRVEVLPAERSDLASLPDLNYPLSRWLAENPHLKEVPCSPGTLAVSVTALNPMDTKSPTAQVLARVESAGYDVEACRVELSALRDHVDVLHGVMTQYQTSMDTIARRRFGYRMQGAQRH